MAKSEPKNSVKGKNIIVLSDGTGNSSAQFFRTNVWRTYEALDLSDPTKQIAFYDDGVGTSSFKPLALLGGAIGIGLSRNVRELFAFLCRNYEPGDRIYGFGFSRGAFTIRILAGFVAKMGLLKPGSYNGEQDLRKKTRWLFRVYRKQTSGNGIPPLLALFIRGLRDMLPGQALDAENYLNSLDQNVGIEFLGLWDTVDAYGLPIDEMTTGWDNYVWPLSMRNYDLSAKVKRAVHALSLDDERNSFHPLLWNETGTQGNTATVNPVRQQANASNIANETLTQVWFAGMHSDVGGGYPDDYLAFIPLNFVLSQLGPKVLFNRAKRKEHQEAARVAGVLHDSRQGLQSYYRLLPRKLEKILNTRRTRFGWFPATNRKLGTIVGNVIKIDRPKIHHTVFDRIKARSTGYSPIVLPKFYAEVAANGAINDVGTNTFETSQDAIARAQAQERVWDLVWWRRITYFATLFSTFYLVLLPWIKSVPSLAGASQPLVELDAGKCIGSKLCFLSGVPKLIGFFLPAFADRWIQTFSANPGVFAFLALAIAGLMLVSKWLDGRIQDRMTAIWHPSAALNTTFSGLRNFRESKAYQRTLTLFKRHLLPLGFGMLALLGILLITVSGASRVVFSFQDAKGIHCVPSQAPAPITKAYLRTRPFNPKDPCWASMLSAEKGATYRIVMEIAAPKADWKDNTLPADLNGILGSHSLVKAIFAWPAKRYVWENYYKPIARIRAVNGAAGQDEYVLNPTFLSSVNSSRVRRDGSSGVEYDCLVSDFTAQSSGELFFFVNDAVIYFKPNGLIQTYGNNGGMAGVYVKRIAMPGEPFSLPPGMSDTSACEEFVSTQP